MLEMVLGYFEQGWIVMVEDYMGGYECEDVDDVMDAMVEDDYVTVTVRIEESEHCVYLHVSDDE